MIKTDRQGDGERSQYNFKLVQTGQTWLKLDGTDQNWLKLAKMGKTG